MGLLSERERGQWAVFYTSPQSVIITILFVAFPTLGTLVNFDRLVYQVKYSNVPTTNFNLIKV